MSGVQKQRQLCPPDPQQPVADSLGGGRDSSREDHQPWSDEGSLLQRQQAERYREQRADDVAEALFAHTRRCCWAARHSAITTSSEVMACRYHAVGGSRAGVITSRVRGTSRTVRGPKTSRSSSHTASTRRNPDDHGDGDGRPVGEGGNLNVQPVDRAGDRGEMRPVALDHDRATRHGRRHRTVRAGRRGRASPARAPAAGGGSDRQRAPGRPGRVRVSRGATEIHHDRSPAGTRSIVSVPRPRVRRRRRRRWAARLLLVVGGLQGQVTGLRE